MAETSLFQPKMCFGPKHYKWRKPKYRNQNLFRPKPNRNSAHFSYPRYVFIYLENASRILLVKDKLLLIERV